MVTAVAMGFAVSFSNFEDNPSAPIAFLVSRLDSSFSTKSYDIGGMSNFTSSGILESMYDLSLSKFGADVVVCGR